MPQWHGEYLKPFFNTVRRMFNFAVRFEGFNPRSDFSEGSEESLILFRDLTRERLSPLKIQRVHGWLSSPSRNISLAIGTPTGAYTQAFIDYDRGCGSHAEKIYFEITTGCTEGCYLHINRDNQVLYKMPLDGSIIFLKKPEIHIQLESIGYKTIHPVPRNQSYVDGLRLNMLERIGRTYQKLMPVLLGMSLIAYIVTTINLFRRKNISVLWIINTSLMAAIAARIFLLSFIDVTWFPVINTLRLAPVYPLLSALPILVFADLIRTNAMDPNKVRSSGTQKIE